MEHGVVSESIACVSGLIDGRGEVFPHKGASEVFLLLVISGAYDLLFPTVGFNSILTWPCILEIADELFQGSRLLPADPKTE